VKEGHPDNRSFLIPDDDVIICKLGIIGMAGHLEVDIKHIGPFNRNPPTLSRAVYPADGVPILGFYLLLPRPYIRSPFKLSDLAC
jgi:hypothetical protein